MILFKRTCKMREFISVSWHLGLAQLEDPFGIRIEESHFDRKHAFCLERDTGLGNSSLWLNEAVNGTLTYQILEFALDALSFVHKAGLTLTDDFEKVFQLRFLQRLHVVHAAGDCSQEALGLTVLQEIFVLVNLFRRP